MNKSALTSKYKHTLTLKNYSQSTVNSYMNGLHKFIQYVQDNELKDIKPAHISEFLIRTKKENGYGYSTMKQLIASVRFLFVEVLQEDIDFHFNHSNLYACQFTLSQRCEKSDRRFRYLIPNRPRATALRILRVVGAACAEQCTNSITASSAPPLLASQKVFPFQRIEYC
jgi:hypothetical protein